MYQYTEVVQRYREAEQSAIEVMYNLNEEFIGKLKKGGCLKSPLCPDNHRDHRESITVILDF